jgi:hypothetical protein
VSLTSELEAGFPPPVVVVVDTNVLIAFKSMVKIDDQWRLLMHMGDLVRSGALTFPRQVARELAYGKFPDAPGAWIGSAKQDVCHPQPDEETLVKVLEVAPQLVDYEATADREVADPYVAAMAYEIGARHPGCHVVIATNDVVDRMPLKLSLKTACDRLGLTICSPDDFIAWITDGTVPGAAPSESPS